MGKRGKKPWEPSPSELAQIEMYAGLGHTQEEVAEYLGKSSDSIYRHANDVFKRGKFRTTSRIAGKCVQQAMDGDFRCMRLYLTTQGGWTEKKSVEISGKLNISHEQVSKLTEAELEALDHILGKLAAGVADQDDDSEGEDE